MVRKFYLIRQPALWIIPPLSEGPLYSVHIRYELRLRHSPYSSSLWFSTTQYPFIIYPPAQIQMDIKYKLIKGLKFPSETRFLMILSHSIIKGINIFWQDYFPWFQSKSISTKLSSWDFDRLKSSHHQDFIHVGGIIPEHINKFNECVCVF